MTAVTGDGPVSQAGVARRARVADGAAARVALRAGRRDWLRRPAVQGLLALVCYAAGWLPTGGRRIIAHLSWAQLDQRSMDPNFYTWSMRWWPFAIAHGLNPAFTHYVGAPAGHSLAWVTTVGPLALLASPVTVTLGPVVAFNLLAVLGLPLAAWAAFVLCRRLTGKFWPSLLGGTVFGFSAYEMNHAVAGQLNLTYSLLLPVLAYLVVVWRDRGISGRAFVILAGLTMAVQFYLFLETFADLTAVLAVALLAGLLLAGPAGRPQLRRLAGLLGLGYAVAIVLAAPYLVYALSTPSPRLIDNTGMDLASLVVPRPSRTFGITWLLHLSWQPIHTSDACYVGIPLLVLVILLAVTRWSSRLVRFLTVLLVVLLVAALGSTLYIAGHRLFSLPWSGLFRLPIVSNAYPLRLMVFAFLVLAVMTALWLAGRGAPAGTLGGRGGLVAALARASWLDWGRWLLGALVIASVVLDAAPMPAAAQTTIPPFISTGRYQHYLSRGENVVIVSRTGNAGMLWQAQSGFYWRLAGGYVNQGITPRSDLPPQVQGLAHATPFRVRVFENYIRTDHIGAILVDIRREPMWVGMFWRVGLKGHKIDGVIVYPTDGCRSCRVLTRAEI